MSKPWMNIFALSHSGSSDSKAFTKICRVPGKHMFKQCTHSMSCRWNHWKHELNVDYSVWITIVVEAILTGQSHLHFCCKFFLWRLKILKRQGVSFFWKSIEKYEINSLTISSKRWQGTESQLPASLNIENLVTNKNFLDASVTSWSQFRTLQWGICCRFVSHFWNCLSRGRCGKDVVVTF